MSVYCSSEGVFDIASIGGNDSTAAPAGQERGGNKAPAAAEMLGIGGIIDLRVKTNHSH